MQTATPFLIETVRDAFVPQTTSALVRVERLGSLPATAKPDTDIAIVLSCGSPVLQARVQELVVCGPPVVVLAESSVEVPFIERDSRMLGLVAATDKVHLLASLARWILERTDKQTAFAANFPFMRHRRRQPHHRLDLRQPRDGGAVLRARCGLSGDDTRAARDDAAPRGGFR